MLVVGKLKVALAATVLMAVGFQAHAGSSSNKKIKESGDWSLWETKGTSGDICYIQSGGEDETYLVMIKAKNNPKSPVETMIQMLDNSKGQTGITVSVPGLASTLSYGDLDGKKFTFQGIPKNLSQAVEIMKNNKPELKLSKVGGKKPAETKISTRGFKDMVKELESRCNAGQPMVDADFERQFINAVADSIDPLKLDPAKSSLIRSIYFAAYDVLLNKRGAEGELAQVLQKYQPQVNELNQNRARAAAVQNSELPAARNDLTQTQTQQATARAEIAKQAQAIPGLTSKRDASQAALDAAERVIAPLRPEYNRLTGSLGQAQSELSSAESRLSYIDGRVPDLDQQRNALENEAYRLEQILPSQRHEASMALSRYNQVSRDRQSYNAQWRRDEMLRQSFEYQRLNQDWQRVSRSMEMADRELRGVIRERDRVANDLRTCQSGAVAPNAVAVEQLTPGGPHEPKPPGWTPGQGGGLVPGPKPPGHGGPGHGGPGHGPGGPGHGPGGPGPGPQPDPGGGLTPVEPPRDCSQLQNALQVANAQVSQKQSEVNGYSSQLRDIERRRERIVRDIDMQVDREYRSLVDAEEQARRAYDYANTTVFNNENRVAQIRRTELPNIASERSQLLNERPSVLSSISHAQSDIASLSNQLNTFRRTNDWDRKEANVNAKAAQLQQDQSALNAATSGKALAERTLQNAIAREGQINAQITALNNELAALNNRAVALNQILAQLPAERAPIDQRIASLAADLKARQDQVVNALK
jgi:predicted  nucleic acid-binding Zn-ribbon protein